MREISGATLAFGSTSQQLYNPTDSLSRVGPLGTKWNLRETGLHRVVREGPSSVLILRSRADHGRLG